MQLNIHNVMHEYLHTPEATCQAFQRVLHIINSMGVTQIVFGVVSLLGCLLVVLLIVAYKHDLHSLRYRLVLVVFASNCLYSLSDLIPVQLFTTSGGRCGYQLLVTDNPVTRSIHGESVFIVTHALGLYASCCAEFAMIAMSIYALRAGKTHIRFAYEAAIYTACVLVACVAAINTVLHSDDTSIQRYRDLNAAIAANDSEAFANVIQREQRSYSQGMTEFFVIPVVLVFMSLGLWVYQRVWLHYLFIEWERMHKEMIEKPGRSVVAESNKLTLLKFQRQGYYEITKPLERYVVVFILFLPPMIFGATNYCGTQTVPNHYYWNEVPCLNITVLMTSFRSLALVIAFFGARKHRKQVYNHKIFRAKLRHRLWWGCCCRPCRSNDIYERRVRFTALSSPSSSSLDVDSDQVERVDDDDVDVRTGVDLCELVGEDGTSEQPYHLMDNDGGGDGGGKR